MALPFSVHTNMIKQQADATLEDIVADTFSDASGNLRTAMDTLNKKIAIFTYDPSITTGYIWGNGNSLHHFLSHKVIGPEFCTIDANSNPLTPGTQLARAGKIKVTSAGTYRLKAHLTPECLSDIDGSDGQGRTQFGAYFSVNGDDTFQNATSAGSWGVVYIRHHSYGQTATFSLDYVYTLAADDEITIGTKVQIFHPAPASNYTDTVPINVFKLHASVEIELLDASTLTSKTVVTSGPVP